MSKHLILGSASPRRRELLSLITEDFTVRLADIDERALENDLEQRHVPACQVSEELASAKAKAVFEMLEPELKGEDLLTAIRALLSDPAALDGMAKAMKSCGVPDATERIADIVLEMVRVYQ